MTLKQNVRIGIILGFGGATIGSIAWLAEASVAAKDWITLSAIIISAMIIYIVSTKICFANPSGTWTVVIWTTAALGLLDLVVLNLRWDHWLANPQSNKHITGIAETLKQANITIAGIFIFIIVIFFAVSKAWKKQFVDQELKQMQIKDL